MPIPGLLAGLEEGLATEVAKQRQDQRTREDREFTQNLQLLDQLRQDPRTTPEMYQRVMQATLQQQKGLGSQRKPKKGMAGFMGQTDTAPYHSDILDQLASGQIPLFQDKAAFDAARTGTSDDLRQHLASGVAGQGSAGAAQPGSPGVPPPPTPQPPSAGANAPISGQTNTATPPAGPPNAAAGAAGAGAQAPAPPPGPIPSLAGTGHMTQAAAGLADNLQAGGPVIPAPPSVTDIYASHKANPSAFFNPQEMSQIQAGASASQLPYQAQSEFGALAPLIGKDRAGLAVARKLTGFTGGVTSHPGQMYIAPDGHLVKSILQSDQYGGFQEVNAQTGEIIGPEMKVFQPSEFQLVTDKNGNIRAVSKAAATVGANATNAVGPSLGAIGKPQIPPPVFGSTQTVFGPNGEPQIVGVPREGGPAVPITVGAGRVPAPPKPGQAPTAPPREAVKFQASKPLSAAAETSLQSINVVKQTGQAALNIIDELTKQGYSTGQPISQEIAFKIYQMGWPNSNELEDQLQQLLGVNQVNGLKNYMGGRPNQRLIQIIQAHLPEPGDSLELSRRKLVELNQITDMIEQAITQAGSVYRKFPWETGAGTGGGQQPRVAPPPPKFTDSK